MQHNSRATIQFKELVFEATLIIMYYGDVLILYDFKCLWRRDNFVKNNGTRDVFMDINYFSATIFIRQTILN
jgi:hypothetical protein